MNPEKKASALFPEPPAPDEGGGNNGDVWFP